MKEELIRIEHGRFRSSSGEYQFDVSIARGECIGVFVDEHLTSGTAYLDIFKNRAVLTGGRAFCCGQRTGATALEHWIHQNTLVVDKSRFAGRELTMRDFVLALGPSVSYRQQLRNAERLTSLAVTAMLRQMGLDRPWDTRLADLSMLDYYRLSVFRAWFSGCELLALDRLTETLRHQDLHRLMDCVQLLLGHGMAVFLFDMDEAFMFRYASRIDVVKERRTFFRLYPEEYGPRLFELLGWERSSAAPRIERTAPADGKPVLSVFELSFPSLPPLTFEVRRGEIAFLRDENYNTGRRLYDCFLGEQGWTSGSFRLNGNLYAHSELGRVIGTDIGIQIERPDRPGGVLFDNLTALDNLCTCLIPKADKRIIRKKLVASILEEASRWFPREMLLRPLSEWSLPDRLRFSYYRWYLLNPRLLLCFFPFAGQESTHHKMIIDLLVMCARRGMAVWIVSSGIDAICEKTDNAEFLRRLRYINE